MKKLFLLLVAVLSIGLYASAQTRTVKGTVIDAHTDEPLIGVSVTVAGESTGVTTDIDGDFAITVPQTATKLSFSYIGYQSQTVSIGSGAKMTVKLLPQANVLDEVIAVAYGTAKRSEYTGSASVVKADQLEDALVSDVTSALSGRVVGVQVYSSNGQPGSAPTVRIRGRGSINASEKPLYVVDGVPYMGDIANLSPQDIEAMTVLKDAASTALYGARGANGVILITTKSGKEGRAHVTFDARWGANTRAVPQYDVISSQPQYLETLYQAMYNTSLNSGNTPDQAYQFVNENIWNQVGGYQTWTIPDGQFAFSRDGKFNPNATPGWSNGRYYFKADDWEKEGLITGLRQEYNVSISGGTDRLQYYLSGTYLSDEGIIRNSHFKRFTTRAKVDYKAFDWLKIGTDMSYIYSDTSSPRDQTNDNGTSSGNVFYFVNSMAPIYPVYVRNPDGSIMINQTFGEKVYDYGGGSQDYGNGRIGVGRTPEGNPISGLIYDKNSYLADVLDAKWYAQITPIKGLSITENVGYFLDNTRQQELLNGVYGQFVSMGGQALQAQLRQRDITLQTLVNYNHTFGEKHEMDLMAAYESEDYAIEQVWAQGTNLFQPDVVFVDNTIDQKMGGGSRAELSHRGFLFRGKYTFDGRYYLVGSIRRDGSSRFAPGHRWGTFWSVSGGWDIAKEKFLEQAHTDWLDQLKFRASFGQNGNDGIGGSTLYMPWADFYTLTGADGVFSSGVMYQKGNRDITWETSNAFNIGFDFSFWKGMLAGSIEYFNRQTSDMLFNLPVPPSMGYPGNSYPANVGSMRNNGLEIELNYQPVNTQNITVDVFANITFGKTKILKLPKEILNENGEWVRSQTMHMREGKPYYDFYLTQWAGVDPENGQALYWAKYTEADKAANPDIEVGQRYKTADWTTARITGSEFTGDIAPLAYGGFGFSVNAYGFDLSATFNYQFGGKLIDYGYQNLMNPGTSIGAWHKDQLNAWTPENPTSQIPALYTTAPKSIDADGNEQTYDYANALSDRFLISSNFVNLQNISLGYNLPQKWISKLKIGGIRIYGAAENVAMWSRRKGLDPRQGIGSAENHTYSPIRTISGGIRVNF